MSGTPVSIKREKEQVSTFTVIRGGLEVFKVVHPTTSARWITLNGSPLQHTEVDALITALQEARSLMPQGEPNGTLDT